MARASTECVGSRGGGDRVMRWWWWWWWCAAWRAGALLPGAPELRGGAPRERRIHRRVVNTGAGCQHRCGAVRAHRMWIWRCSCASMHMHASKSSVHACHTDVGMMIGTCTGSDVPGHIHAYHTCAQAPDAHGGRGCARQAPKDSLLQACPSASLNANALAAVPHATSHSAMMPPSNGAHARLLLLLLPPLPPFTSPRLTSLHQLRWPLPLLPLPRAFRLPPSTKSTWRLRWACPPTRSCPRPSAWAAGLAARRRAPSSSTAPRPCPPTTCAAPCACAWTATRTCR